MTKWPTPSAHHGALVICPLLLGLLHIDAITLDEMHAPESREYHYIPFGPTDPASERVSYYNGTVKALEDIPGWNISGRTVYCTNPLTGGKSGCSWTYAGVGLIDFGSRTQDVLSVGAAFRDVYLMWDGDDAGQDIGDHYFQPFLWADQGHLLAEMGDYLATGSPQQMSKQPWTEWNFTRIVKGLTGRVWVGLRYVAGPTGWLFPAFRNPPQPFYVATWPIGSNELPLQYTTSAASFGSAMLYLKTIYNCTRDIQCSGHGDCVPDSCHCDPGWSGPRCDQHLLSPPIFTSDAGPVPPGARLALTHSWACPFLCYTTDPGVVPVCGLSGTCAVGMLYTVPFLVTHNITIAAVACASDGASSAVVQKTFWPLGAWTCTEGQTVNVELERSSELQTTYAAVYDPNSNCRWQFGTAALAGQQATVTFSEFVVGLSTHNNLTILTGWRNGRWQGNVTFHILNPPPINQILQYNLPMQFVFLSDASDQRSGFTLTLSYAAGASGPVCGNGIRHPYEACDDGNLVDGDGCSALCEVEAGWACPGFIGGLSVCARPACVLTCANGGRCEVTADGLAQCVCPLGWTGAQCDEDANMCECAFCQEVCWERAVPNVTCCTAAVMCSGHGTCGIAPDTCNCWPPYWGPTCAWQNATSPIVTDPPRPSGSIPFSEPNSNSDSPMPPAPLTSSRVPNVSGASSSLRPDFGLVQSEDGRMSLSPQPIPSQLYDSAPSPSSNSLPNLDPIPDLDTTTSAESSSSPNRISTPSFDVGGTMVSTVPSSVTSTFPRSPAPSSPANNASPTPDSNTVSSARGDDTSTSAYVSAIVSNDGPDLVQSAAPDTSSSVSGPQSGPTLSTSDKGGAMISFSPVPTPPAGHGSVDVSHSALDHNPIPSPGPSVEESPSGVDPSTSSPRGTDSNTSLIPSPTPHSDISEASDGIPRLQSEPIPSTSDKGDAVSSFSPVPISPAWHGSSYVSDSASDRIPTPTPDPSAQRSRPGADTSTGTPQDNDASPNLIPSPTPGGNVSSISSEWIENATLVASAATPSPEPNYTSGAISSSSPPSPESTLPHGSAVSPTYNSDPAPAPSPHNSDATPSSIPHYSPSPPPHKTDALASPAAESPLDPRPGVSSSTSVLEPSPQTSLTPGSNDIISILRLDPPLPSDPGDSLAIVGKATWSATERTSDYLASPTSDLTASSRLDASGAVLSPTVHVVPSPTPDPSDGTGVSPNSYAPPASPERDAIDGPTVVYVTLEELGRSHVEWHCSVLSTANYNQTITVTFNSSLFAVSPQANQVAEPLTRVYFVLTLQRPPVIPPPQKVVANIRLAVGESDDAYTALERLVVIYVLPEPWLTSRNGRSGDYLNCGMVHNDDTSFTAILDVQGDLPQPLFRGVRWNVSSTTPIIQGNPLQLRMTVPVWALGRGVMPLMAVITFALPEDTSYSVDVLRQCEVLINAGPNCSAATTVLTAPLDNVPLNTTLQPQARYRILISGWNHFSPIIYAVWYYWADAPNATFQLSLHSESTEHFFDCPGRVGGGGIVVVVHATDVWGYPDVWCPGSEWPAEVASLSPAEYAQQLEALLAGDWQSVEPVLTFLASAGNMEETGDELQQSFITKVENVSRYVEPNEFILETAFSFANQMALRSTVTWYDLAICKVFSSLLDTNSSNVTNDASLQAVAWLYGTVMRTDAEPLLDAAQAIWAALAGPPDNNTVMETGAPPSSQNARRQGRRETGSVREEFIPGSTMAEVALLQFVVTLMNHKVANTSFRDLDCIQSDPHDPNVPNLCYTICSLTAYRDEFGSNFPHLLLLTHQAYLPPGAKELLQFLLLNQAWFQWAQPRLPEILTVASIRIGPSCHFDGVAHNLAGSLWRLWLYPEASTVPVEPFDAKPRIIVPAEIEQQPHDCVMKHEMGSGFLYGTIPRSSLNGYCMTKQLGWISVTDPNAFPPAVATGFPWLPVVCALLVTLTLGLLTLPFCWRHYRVGATRDLQSEYHRAASCTAVPRWGVPLEVQAAGVGFTSAPDLERPASFMTLSIALIEAPNLTATPPPSPLCSSALPRTAISPEAPPSLTAWDSPRAIVAHGLPVSADEQEKDATRPGARSNAEAIIYNLLQPEMSVAANGTGLGIADATRLENFGKTSEGAAALHWIPDSENQLNSRQSGTGSDVDWMGRDNDTTLDATWMDSRASQPLTAFPGSLPDAVWMDGGKARTPDAWLMDSCRQAQADRQPHPVSHPDAVWMDGDNKATPDAWLMDSCRHRDDGHQQPSDVEEPLVQWMDEQSRMPPEPLLMSAVGQPAQLPPIAPGQDGAEWMDSTRLEPDALLMDPPFYRTNALRKYEGEEVAWMDMLRSGLPIAVSMDSAVFADVEGRSGPETVGDVAWMNSCLHDPVDADVMDTIRHPCGRDWSGGLVMLDLPCDVNSEAVEWMDGLRRPPLRAYPMDDEGAQLPNRESFEVSSPSCLLEDHRTLIESETLPTAISMDSVMEMPSERIFMDVPIVDSGTADPEGEETVCVTWKDSWSPADSEGVLARSGADGVAGSMSSHSSNTACFMDTRLSDLSEALFSFRDDPDPR